MYALKMACVLFAVAVAIFALWSLGAAGGDVRVNHDLRVHGNDITLNGHDALHVDNAFVPGFIFPPGPIVVLGSLTDVAYASVRATLAVGTRVAEAFITIPGEPGLVELHTPIASLFSLPVVSFIGFFSPSDARGKEHITTLSTAECLATVDALRPVTFHWTDEYRASVGMQDNVQQVGFIAQEVEAVVPQAITRSSMRVGDTEYDDWRDLDKEMLVPLLVGAIKELRQRVDELERA